MCFVKYSWLWMACQLSPFSSLYWYSVCTEITGSRRYMQRHCTLAAGQVPYHLQNCYHHASDFPPSMPVVPLWPHRVCFGRLECTPTSFLQYSSRRRQTKQDAVRKACLLSGRPRHMEQSPRHHPYHRLPPSLPSCAKDTSVPLSIRLLVLY